MKPLKFNEFINEKKPAGAPDWHDSDAPDAEGRFRDLGIKDLASWLIKTRKKDVKKISGSLTQQIVFNRKDDPEYAEKMEKVRKEVYKQLGREDLLESDLIEESLYSFIGKTYDENGYITLIVGEYTKRNDALNFITYDKKRKQMTSAGVTYVKGGKIDMGTEIPLTAELKKEIKMAIEAELKYPDSLFRDQDDIAYDAKDAMRIYLRESAIIDTEGEITCKNCGWEWKISEGGEKPYVCHKCGHDNEELNEDTKIDLGGAETLEIKKLQGGISLVQKSKISSGKNVIVIPQEYIGDLIDKLKKEI